MSTQESGYEIGMKASAVNARKLLDEADATRMILRLVRIPKSP